MSTVVVSRPARTKQTAFEMYEVAREEVPTVKSAQVAPFPEEDAEVALPVVDPQQLAAVSSSMSSSSSSVVQKPKSFAFAEPVLVAPAGLVKPIVDGHEDSPLVPVAVPVSEEELRARVLKAAESTKRSTLQAKDHIENVFTELETALKVRKAQLLKDAEKAEAERLELLGLDEENNLDDDLLETMARAKISTLEGCGETDVFFVYNREILENLYSFGEIGGTATVAKKCEASGLGLQHANVGAESKFTIIAKDFRGIQQTKGGDVFVCSPVAIAAVQSNPQLRLGSNLVDGNDGTYTCTYGTPMIDPRQHTHVSISITLKDEHLPGSPFSVALNFPAPPQMHIQRFIPNMCGGLLNLFNGNTVISKVGGDRDWNASALGEPCFRYSVRISGPMTSYAMIGFAPAIDKNGMNHNRCGWYINTYNGRLYSQAGDNNRSFLDRALSSRGTVLDLWWEKQRGEILIAVNRTAPLVAYRNIPRDINLFPAFGIYSDGTAIEFLPPL